MYFYLLQAESLSKEIRATEESQAHATVNLSEREKRALAAEKRMAAISDIDLAKYENIISIKLYWYKSSLSSIIITYFQLFCAPVLLLY